MTMRPEHVFTGTRQDWEKVVFDNAVCFAVLQLQARPFIRTEFPTFAEARAFAEKADQGPCVYAIAASERATLLAQKEWDMWSERENSRVYQG